MLLLKGKAKSKLQRKVAKLKRKTVKTTYLSFFTYLSLNSEDNKWFLNDI